MNNTEGRDVVQPTLVKRQKLNQGATTNESNEMIKKYGVGAKLLSRMGYKIGHGLGSDGTGISKPIEAIKRPQGKAGLGTLSMIADYQNNNNNNNNMEDDNGYSSSSSSSSTSVLPAAYISSNENRVNDGAILSYKKNKKSTKNKKIVFNKKGTVTLNNMERLKLINRLKDLEINYPTIKIPYTLLDDLRVKTVISKESRLQLSDIAQKLEHIGTRVESLNDRIANLKLQHESLTNSSSILADIDLYLSTKDSDLFLMQVPECIKKILLIEDDDTVDILMSRFLRQLFIYQNGNTDKNQQKSYNTDGKNDNEFWLLKDTPFQKYFLPIVDVLQYRIDENMYLNKKLNRTQTVIFQNVYPVIITLIETIKLGSDLDFNTLVATLIAYEQLLKYLNCHEFLLETVLMPKIEDTIYDDWDLNDDTVDSHWLINILILLSPEEIKDINDMVKNKFEDYCYRWYYRDPIISRQNLLIVQQILNDDNQFYKISRTHLLPNFVKLIDKYFDLEYDMDHFNNNNYIHSDDDDNVDKSQDTFDSIYVFKFIRDHRYIFQSKVYEILILSLFNSVNKFIFDWCFYYKDNQMLVQRAKNWFNWFINKVFSGFTELNTPSNFEISQIKKSKEFLSKLTYYPHNNSDEDTVDIMPIHDETFNIMNSLESIYEEIDKGKQHVDSNSEEDKVESLPMRKVTVNFKEVVEDYCFEKGYILQKLNNKYTDISFGPSNSVLVPIYRVRSGSKYRNIAIKDDILWVEDDKGDYIPTYLHKLKI